MLKKLAFFILPVIALAFIFPSMASAYEVPKENSKAEYFYVFGPEGDPLRGKEDTEFSLFVDVPKGSEEPVTISVYDPDTSKDVDSIGGFGKPTPDTDTEFSVEGKSGIAKEVFGAGNGNKKWVKLATVSPTDGRDVGDFYRFRVNVRAISGDDQNLFKFKVSPNYVETFSENITFRLLPGSGDKIYFHPAVAEGVTDLTIRNFDLDAEGGRSVLVDRATGKEYGIKDSLSGQWVETNVALGSSTGRRLQYVVTTTKQKRGNAGVQILDAKGKALPIYFKRGGYEAPVVPPAEPNACNVFVFDGTKSHDPNNDKITYKWDFGDGSTSTEPVVKHVYNAGGAYNVTLTVADNSGLHCETATSRSKVEVNTPPTCAVDAPGLACAGQGVTFDATGSSDDQTADLAYTWSFSDGTSATGAKVTKVFEKGGVYTANVTADDKAGTKCSVCGAGTQVRINTPPVANAGEDVALCLTNANADYAVSFNAGKSYDADKDSLSYSWDFGDGSTAEGANVTHVYKQSGNYTARVTVRDNSGAGCSVDTDTVSIRLNKAPLADAGADQFSCANGEITLTAGNAYEEAGENVKYTWDLGDGTTATGKTVTHKYPEGGVYKAVLTVDDGQNSPCSTSMDTATVRINGRPTADLREVKAVCVGDKVVLDAGGSRDPDGDSLKYVWNLGDGTVVDSGSSISHKYAQGGDYRVSVRVDDGAGESCGVAQDSIVVNVNTPPVASAGPNLVCCTDEQSQFDGSASSDADGDTLSYQWTFGDGGSGSGVTTSHSYGEYGQYNVTLTVDDGSGTACSADSSGFVADVNARPVSVIAVREG